MADDDESTSSTAPKNEEPKADTSEGATPAGDGTPEIPAAVKAALRKANKEAETLRLKVKELEDRDKTEAEKVTERLTQAEQRAAAAEANLLRMQVAAEKGLTPAQAKRLVGSSREELEADADELVASFPTQQQPAPVNGNGTKIRPTPNLKRQVPVTDGGEQRNASAAMNDWLRSAARR